MNMKTDTRYENEHTCKKRTNSDKETDRKMGGLAH